MALPKGKKFTLGGGRSKASGKPIAKKREESGLEKLLKSWPPKSGKGKK